jgi:hypothetical protein
MKKKECLVLYQTKHMISSSVVRLPFVSCSQAQQKKSPSFAAARKRGDAANTMLRKIHENLRSQSLDNRNVLTQTLTPLHEFAKEDAQRVQKAWNVLLDSAAETTQPIAVEIVEDTENDDEGELMT